ncbi:MAG TPA: hypothetical protein VK177_13480 [Flavobacteriales bacterium]|nr:hypothetical protein [Flavobacteriales bacterium]
MYKQHLLTNLEREITLLKRLAALIEEKDLDYRPGEKLRSTHELMIYLSYIGELSIYWMLNKDMTPDERKAMRESNMHVTLADFPARIDAQWQRMQDLLKNVTDEQLLTQESEMPWKEKMPLGSALLNSAVKFLTTYRMQLFINLKLNGRPELGTKEAWVP